MSRAKRLFHHRELHLRSPPHGEKDRPSATTGNEIDQPARPEPARPSNHQLALYESRGSEADQSERPLTPPKKGLVGVFNKRTNMSQRVQSSPNKPIRNHQLEVLNAAQRRSRRRRLGVQSDPRSARHLERLQIRVQRHGVLNGREANGRTEDVAARKELIKSRQQLNELMANLVG